MRHGVATKLHAHKRHHEAHCDSEHDWDGGDECEGEEGRGQELVASERVAPAERVDHGLVAGAEHDACAVEGGVEDFGGLGSEDDLDEVSWGVEPVVEGLARVLGRLAEDPRGVCGGVCEGVRVAVAACDTACGRYGEGLVVRAREEALRDRDIRRQPCMHVIDEALEETGGHDGRAERGVFERDEEG